MSESRFGGGVLLGILLALPVGCVAAPDPIPETKIVKVEVPTVIHDRAPKPETKVIYKVVELPDSCLEYVGTMEKTLKLANKIEQVTKDVSDLASNPNMDKFVTYHNYEAMTNPTYQLNYKVEDLKMWRKSCLKDIEAGRNN